MGTFYAYILLAATVLISGRPRSKSAPSKEALIFNIRIAYSAKHSRSSLALQALSL
jgi:hypothetical protein